MASIYDSRAGGWNGSGSATSSSSQSRGTYGNLPPGVWNAGGRDGNNAYVRQTNPNELVSTQMSALLDDPNSAYMANARRNGMNVAGNRGLMNSSIAAGNSQRQAIEAGMPIAQGDAAAYQSSAAQNQDALNAILAEQMGNASSESIARIGANASMYGDDLGLMNQREGRAFGGEQAGLDRAFQDYMSQLGHSQDVDMSNIGYQHDLGRGFQQIAGNLMQGQQQFRNTMARDAAGNPAIMSDPVAFNDFMNWVGSQASSQIDNLINSIIPTGGNP